MRIGRNAHGWLYYDDGGKLRAFTREWDGLTVSARETVEGVRYSFGIADTDVAWLQKVALDR